jgi:hypothetical protein
MLPALMNRVAAIARYSLAVSITAFVVLACASEEDTVFEIGEGRPDASMDTGLPSSSGGGPGSGGRPGSGGGPSFDPCQADFCPLVGPGAPCCVTPDGPCGMDTGMGCTVEVAGPDI